MRRIPSIRLALAASALMTASVVSPALAFGPTVVVHQGDPEEDITLTDMAARGAQLALTTERRLGGDDRVVLAWSGDRGATWEREFAPGIGVREAEATVCAATAVAVYTAPGAGGRKVQNLSAPIAGGLFSVNDVSTSGQARKPDVACVANHGVAVAWFQRASVGWRVKVRTVGPSGQTFDLGKAAVGRGLAIASSADRVYVAWFKGQTLKLRRFAIGSGAQRKLTSLGTTMVATLPYGANPELGADGARVVLAFMDRADLKVRRSTNRGLSFGGATTLRNEPFPSEIGAFPITVAVKGKRMAVGGVEIGGIETLVGRGLGYLSTNGGATWTLKATHPGGRTAAGLVKAGGVQRYAEAWDRSIADPLTERVRFRRD